MTERVNALVEASNLADLGNTRMSTQMASYYTNEVNKQPDTMPMMSYGIQITRQAEAPPSDLVDTESKLNNRYDILGRSGYVYRQGAYGQGARRPPAAAPAPTAPKKTINAEDFFSQISTRDDKECKSYSIWRDDIIRVQRPYQRRQAHVDTRQMTKDRIDQRCPPPS
tara:strand:+ start:2445 stop:2948 length:504 start_codon:yes stop_codon:yes gene_type:complete